MGYYIIAKYLRLSLDDATTDSMSIENQRLILDKHIAELGIDCTEILEFEDNGYSGTSFERPGIQELLELVRTGGVSCICVKDFSRFGRDAIEAGYLLERVFPLFGVRFISVSDGFDSAEHEGGTGGIEVAFKLLIHEFYSKDLSRKVKAAAHERMRRGERVSKNGVFGYTLDKQRNMVTDDPAAETVRRIFELALADSSVAEIAKCLYTEKRPAPGEYRTRTVNPACIWSAAAVRQILANEQYVGTYIAGKTEITEVGSKSETAKRRDIQVSPLKGKVICGCCDHAMQLSMTKNSPFNCRFTQAASSQLRLLTRSLNGFGCSPAIDLRLSGRLRTGEQWMLNSILCKSRISIVTHKPMIKTMNCSFWLTK